MLPAMDKTMFPGTEAKGSENQLSHCAASPLLRVWGYFRVKQETFPSSALAHNLLQMNGLWASRTSLLSWQVGQMMGSTLEQGSAWGSSWAGVKSLCPGETTGETLEKVSHIHMPEPQKLRRK